MNTNQQLIENFYLAFKNSDAETMANCYHPQIEFSDPVFPDLKQQMPANMWRMLCQRLKNSPSKLAYSNVWVEGDEGGCDWEAEYLFSTTGRQVHNKITAKFKFKDGKIISHQDSFNFWRWSRMALGTPGYVLGWSPFLRGKVQLQAANGLQQFIQSLQKA